MIHAALAAGEYTCARAHFLADLTGWPPTSSFEIKEHQHGDQMSAVGGGRTSSFRCGVSECQCYMQLCMDGC